MGLTYTPAHARDRLRPTSDASARNRLVLVATGLVSAAAILLCYTGRIHAFEIGEAQRAGPPPVNLTRVTAVDPIEAALARAFDRPEDRRFGAEALLQALTAEDARLTPANVGGLTRVAVPVAAIDRARHLRVFADRLHEARDKAAVAKAPAPPTLPLFTSVEVTAIKPAMVVRTVQEHRFVVVWTAVAFLLGFQAVSLFWRWRGVAGDDLLLSAAHLLATLGFLVMLSRPDPLRDSLLLVRYTESVLIGLGLCAVLSMVHVRTASVLRLSYLSLACAVVLSVVLFVFGSGPGASGAKVNLGPAQPIEAIRLLILLFLAGYLGRRWELVRELRATAVRGRRVPDWLSLPPFDQLLPMAGGVGIALVLFFALRDLGPALLLSLIFLSMLAVARARPGVAAAGIALLAAGFYAGYWLDISPTLAARVAMWQSPWNNAVRGGDQIAQAAWALATGSIPGTGLGLGDPRYLPAGHTDLVLAAVGEELGGVGILTAAAAFAVIAWRGLRIARRSATDFAVFLAVALTLSLVAPALVMASGIRGLIPLTGVVTPFLSYGGSAMLVNFAMLGLIVAAGADRRDDPDAQPFVVPIRWLGHALGATAAAVLVAWFSVQAVSADAFLVKPQLSVQGDGGLRYQYNPRVLDAMRGLPRGNVLDRHDIPLAANAAAARAAEHEYSSLHVSLRDACPNALERCYPFGGSLFHVLGDVKTRTNWTASNTSFVERDEDAYLRGFDDRAAAVRTEGDNGRWTLAVRRDYRDLVPLVRHRWQPDNPSVRDLRTRPRDLSLTIDARLQSQLAAILARSSGALGIQHAAAVVLDADSGELLATVSFPWPEAEFTEDANAADALLDRARFGLYPPGSTFKLVTAAAALRLDPAYSQQAFTCSVLPDGRVGAKIPGFGRPVRDDILDQHPHGTLTMHDGIVRSCNAYFAQLAVRIGTPALATTAALAGISYPTTGSPETVRANLPYSGYGQGRVLATPLRMARVAAAIATDGMIRAPSIVRRDTPVTPTPFLSPDSARLLAGYMRDVVTDGTGRLLRTHPIHIAGKTGTAEVDVAKSHSWFIGFAPSGQATRRIAFAVIVENAGYGGTSAASVAGQLVSAAASLGLVK